LPLTSVDTLVLATPGRDLKCLSAFIWRYCAAVIAPEVSGVAIFLARSFTVLWQRSQKQLNDIHRDYSQTTRSKRLRTGEVSTDAEDVEQVMKRGIL